MEDALDINYLKSKLLDRKSFNSKGCWIWKGCRIRGGYGQIKYNMKCYYVHRIAAYIWLGFNIDSEMEVCHHCDIPCCFNPEHLFISDHFGNMKDSVAKGRFKK